MERSGVSQRVTSVVAHVLAIDPAEVLPASNFVFDLGADSMKSVELIAGFEEEFDIEMDEERPARSRRSMGRSTSSRNT